MPSLKCQELQTCQTMQADSAVDLCLDVSSKKKARLLKTCDLNITCEKENTTSQQKDDSGLLDVICRGCSKEMIRLLAHLNSKKGIPCKEKYSDAEIESHKKATAKKTKSRYQTKNREKIISYHESYDK